MTRRKAAPGQTVTLEPERGTARPRQLGDLDLLAAALAGDGYGWLAARLPAPVPLACPRCGGLLLPRIGAIVPACPACYPAEAHDAGL